MNFDQFLAVMRARWKVPVLIFLAFLGLFMLAYALLPSKYTGVAQVVIDSNRIPDPVSGTVLPQTPQYLATQVDIIQSDRVAKLVVKRMKLLDSQELRSSWQNATGGQGDYETWVAESLTSALDIKPGKGSNTIEIGFIARDPQFASVMANQFMRAYIDTTLELRVDPARSFDTMFATQLSQARDKLDEAQKKLSKFQQEEGLIATDERMDVESARLNELSAQYVGLQAARSEAVSRAARSGMTGPDSMNYSVIMGLKADLARQIANLKELSSRYGESHPNVAQAKEGIEELKRRIQAESANVTQTSNSLVDIAKQNEAQGKATLDAQREKVLKLKSTRDQAKLFEQDVESAQRAFDLIQARMNQTALESQINQANVSVLQYATPPYRPTSPRLMLFLLQAVFLGLFVGIWAAIFLELRRRRVRIEHDVSALIGTHLIGRMPSLAKKGDRKLPIALAPKLPNKAMLTLPGSSAQ